MTKYSFVRPFAGVALMALLGAGCATPRIVNGPATNVNAKLGFGKIPGLTAPSPMALSYAASDRAVTSEANVPPVAAGVPMMAAPSSVSAVGGANKVVSGTANVIARPIPSPYPKPQLGTVEYLVEGTLPSWGAEGDVLHAQKSLPNVSQVSAFAQQSGVPAQVFGSDSTILSMSAQWKDKDGFQWTYDAGSRNLSFWKEYANPNYPNKNQPVLDQAAAIKAADAFLDAHGFSNIRSQGGSIQDTPWIYPMMKSSISPMMKGAAEPAIYPCPMGADTPTIAPDGAASAPAKAAPAPNVATATVESSGSGSVGSGVVAPSMPTRYPCGWWPTQVTIAYGQTRDGQKVVDISGYPSQNASLSVDISTYQVTNGSMQLEMGTERSSYPLIDQQTATRRLQAGGRNPVWAYSENGGSIKVHLKTMELVWMRYDVWQNVSNETYFLPALLASGTVDRGQGADQEPYRTVIPLVQDDQFDTKDGGPIPYGASGGAAETLPAPAPAPAPAPLPKAGR